MKNGCKARAIIPVDGDIEQLRITRNHNHPPDENAEEKEEFLKQLKVAVKSMPGSMKKIYDNMAQMYVLKKYDTPDEFFFVFTAIQMLLRLYHLNLLVLQCIGGKKALMYGSNLLFFLMPLLWNIIFLLTFLVYFFLL